MEMEGKPKQNGRSERSGSGRTVKTLGRIGWSALGARRYEDIEDRAADEGQRRERGLTVMCN